MEGNEIKANARGEVTIELDQERFIRYNHNSICDIEEALGINMLVGANPLHFGYRGLRAMLWAGLRHYKDPKFTLVKVGEHITNENKNALVKAVLAAFEHAFPATKEEEQPDPNAQRAAASQ
jgi:hypothetical protein